MSRSKNISSRFHRWRLKNLSETGFITALSVAVGVLSGLAAVVLKNAVWLTQDLVHSLVSQEVHNYFYFALPLLGILLALNDMKFIIRRQIKHGIPNVL